MIGVVTAAILAVSTNVAFHRSRRPPVQDLVKALAPVAPVREARPVGKMMYAEVSAFLWDQMSSDERVDTVEEFARIATEQGFTLLYVNDESRRAVARWTSTDGVRIVEREGER